MTLVAGFSLGGMPAFVGDLLLSWRLPSKVDLPTRRDVEVVKAADGSYAKQLAQKLVILRPYFMLAWAGRQAEADRLFQALNAILPEKLEDFTNPLPAFEILDTCADGTEMVLLIATEKSVHPYTIRTRSFELDDRRIYLLGSGAEAFFRYLNQYPAMVPGLEQNDGMVAQGAMLRFASQSFAWQLVGGVGFDKSWGGGFEVAYPTPQGLRKINNVLYRSWLLEDGELKSSGRAFFSRYYGEDLYLSCIEAEQKTYFVESPVGRGVDPPAEESLCPEWTLDSFMVAATGAVADIARYQPSYRPVKDKFHFRKGALVGWAMDKEHVEECAARVLATNKHPGGLFQLDRY